VKFRLITLTIIALIFCGSLSAGQVESVILQNKLNRLYFSVGTETMVFPEASFVVICGADTLAHGYIEFTAPGIAVSKPDSLFASIDLSDSCQTLVETAELDTTSTIRIGIIDQTENLCVRLVCSNDTTRAFECIPYPSKIDLAVAFDTGAVDLALALDNIPITRKSRRYESAAPLLAAMIPNPAAEINKHALLTTSLYYRYSSPNSSLFDGLTPTIEYCLYPRDQVCRREYIYNPESGRKLAARLKVGDYPITLAYSDPSLEKCALFFGDILSRDRLPVVFARTEPSADLELNYYDFDPERPTAGLKEIIEYLSQMTGNKNETIISAANNIAEADRADSSRCQHYCDLASSRLIQEIGVFPLFRINYLVLAQSNIDNIKFASGGALLIDSLVKIQMPDKESGQ